MKRLTQVITFACSISLASMALANSNQDAVDKAYIAGFLAGAQLTDNEIIRRLDDGKPDEKYSDFFQRAFDTRVGSAREKLPATFYAGFCLPDNAVSADVIARIYDSLGQPAPDKAAQIFEAVRTQYPCR